MNNEKFKKKIKRNFSNFKVNFMLSSKHRFEKIKTICQEKIPVIISSVNEIRITVVFISIILLLFAIVTNAKRNEQELIIDSDKKEEIVEIVPEIEEIKKVFHVSLKVSDDGYNIYAPATGKSGYRYGPSVLMNDDGSFDVWFSSPGNNVDWDWITYMHSDDGKSWSKEKIVLQPTGDSYDHYSVCDPGVVYFNDYYYLGYTSTIVSTNEGINNNIYVARSKNPDGPYEKWNGNGWGGKPKPIIYYDESNDFWGAGEISFVIANEKLYCYYTWDCEHGRATRVATASLSEDWPSTIEFKNVIYDNKYGQDSCDVVYLDEYNKFLAFSISERFSNNSGVLIYESDDGINFHRTDNVHTNVCMYAHNMGFSKRKDGHIKENDNLYISYAYSNSENSKGRWATRFEPVKLIVYENINRIFQDEGGVSIHRSNYSKNKVPGYIVGINVNKKTINVDIDDKANITTYLYNQYRESSQISKNITYEYDENIICIKGNTIHPVSVGTCVVYVHYKDFYTTFTVNVKDTSTTSSEIVTFKPIEDVFEFHLKDENSHSKQIRAYVEFANRKWGECYNDYTSDHPKYPAMIDADEYLMEFEVENEKIVSVDNDGTVIPRNIGTTNIKVTINGDKSFDVKVIVKF